MFRKTWERVALRGPGPAPYQEDQTRAQRQPRRLCGIRIGFPKTAGVVLNKERALNGNFLSIAAEANGKNTNYQDNKLTGMSLQLRQRP